MRVAVFPCRARGIMLISRRWKISDKLPTATTMPNSRRNLSEDELFFVEVCLVFFSSASPLLIVVVAM